ncbi:MAG: hypothetical protein QOJ19_750 [Acidimicrobiia bacterium]|nr:hypothetical protein [Acidimicrobiia bacterium]
MSTVQRSDIDLSVQPKQPDKSLGELFTSMTADLSTLMRKEVELAKVEVKEEANQAAKAGAMLGAGAFSAYLALLFVSFALAWLLDAVMPTALAFLIVAVVYGIAAAVLLPRGRDRLKAVHPIPEQTADTLKEDVQWAKAQKS